MGTSEIVANRAVALVREGKTGDAAVLDLRETSMGNRVSVVMAKQRLDTDDADADTRAAIELLDLTLEAGDWAS